MYIRGSKFGKFYGCAKYPSCDGIKQILSSIKCPKCEKGSVVGKYSPKAKKKFWTCSEYPKCDFITNNEPLPEQCPKCKYSNIEIRYKKVPNGFQKYKSCPACKEKFEIGD
jgi:DNA topoisomerase-1